MQTNKACKKSIDITISCLLFSNILSPCQSLGLDYIELFFLLVEKLFVAKKSL